MGELGKQPTAKGVFSISIKLNWVLAVLVNA